MILRNVRQKVAAMLMFTLLLWLANGMKLKEHGVSMASDALVLGQDVPLGPLSHLFTPKQRLPGFPFELPSILPGSTKQYRLFPMDSASNYASAARRCKALGGRLAHLSGAVEMEILACTIQQPIFIGAWESMEGNCLQMWPGGVIVSTPDGCTDILGSLCEVS